MVCRTRSTTPYGQREQYTPSPAGTPGCTPASRQTPLWEGSPQLGHIRVREDGFNICVPAPPGLVATAEVDNRLAKQRRQAVLHKAELILTMRRWSGLCTEAMALFSGPEHRASGFA